MYWGAGHWLTTSLDTSAGAHEAEAVLERIEYGVYSDDRLADFEARRKLESRRTKSYVRVRQLGLGFSRVFREPRDLQLIGSDTRRIQPAHQSSSSGFQGFAISGTCRVHV